MKLLSFPKTLLNARREFSLVKGLKDVVIVSAARTPIGAFKGTLSAANAPYLGSIAIRAAINRATIDPKLIQEVYMGIVLQAGVGQDPARQATIFSGLPETVPTTTVNKVCASGMKAIMLAAQNIASGAVDVMVAGGMESMSNTGFMLQRRELKYGGETISDLLVQDGLTDVYSKVLMGTCAEKCAIDNKITREDQDNFSIESYKRAKNAAAVFLSREITPVKVSPTSTKSPFTVTEDEEWKRLPKEEQVRHLRPAFMMPNPAVLINKKSKEAAAIAAAPWSPTVTGANASKLSDGAAACVLMSAEAAQRHKCVPLAVIRGFADACVQPVDFPVAPVEAINKLLKQTGLTVEDISWWEINEAFAAVSLANIKLLNLNPALVNPNGGAVSLGHPLGMSGARITNILALHLQPGQKGIAAICNGGGGASAILVEKLNPNSWQSTLKLA